MKVLTILWAVLFSSLAQAYPIGFKATTLTTKYPALVDFGFLKATNSGSTTTISSLGDAAGDSLVLGGTKAASAILDVQSTTQGVLSPRMTTAQMNAISSPSAGLTVYNTDFKSLALYDGTVWTYGFGNLSVGTDWVSYTPTLGAAWGTTSPTTNQCKWKLDGADLLIKCSFAVGTPVAGSGSVSMPSGYTIDSSRLIRQNTTSAPGDKVGFGQADGNGSNTNAFVTAPATSLTNFYSANLSSSIPNLTPTTTLVSHYQPGVIFSTEEIRLPILGLSSNTSAWVQANSNPIATTTEFSAQVAAANTVSGENVEFVTGNAIISDTSLFTLTLSGFTATPNCSATYGADPTVLVVMGNATVASASSTSVVVRTLLSNTANSFIKSAQPFILKCQRSGADYTAAHSPFIIGTFEGKPATWTNYGVFTADTTLFGQGTMTGSGATPCKWKRMWNELKAYCSFTGGTVTGTMGAILLPTGLVIDSAQLMRTNTTSGDGDKVGEWRTNNANTLGNIVTATGAAIDRVYMAGSYNNALMLRPTAPNGFVASGVNWTMEFTVPIVGW